MDHTDLISNLFADAKAHAHTIKELSESRVTTCRDLEANRRDLKHRRASYLLNGAAASGKNEAERTAILDDLLIADEAAQQDQADIDELSDTIAGHDIDLTFHANMLRIHTATLHAIGGHP